MQGRASTTSLLRLVLCAGFLCVAWILLSPGDARAAEPVRPEPATPVSAVAGLPTPSRAVTGSLERVVGTAGSVLEHATEPLRPAPAPAPVSTTAPKARTSSPSTGSHPRSAPKAEERSTAGATARVVTEVEAVVRTTTRAVSSAVSVVTTVTEPVPPLHEPVDVVGAVVDETVGNLTEGFLDLGTTVLDLPHVPGLPALPTPPGCPVSLPPASPAPAVVHLGPAAPVRGGAGSPWATASDPRVSPTTGVGTAALASSSWHSPGDQATRDDVTSSRADERGPAPLRDGRNDLTGMPLGTGPSGSSAAPAAGHGATADGVVARHRFDAPGQGRWCHRDEHVPTGGPADRPGARPD